MVDVGLSSRQKTLHLVLFIGGDLLWNRLNKKMSDEQWSENTRVCGFSVCIFIYSIGQDSRKFKVWTYIQLISKIYVTASILHYVLFLWEGKYVTILERLLSMRRVYTRRNVVRQVDFEYMNREMVWMEMTVTMHKCGFLSNYQEFMSSVLPYINLGKIKSYFKGVRGKKKRVISDLPSHLCLICIESNTDGIAKRVKIPYVTQCNHQFCYYCIK